MTGAKVNKLLDEMQDATKGECSAVNGNKDLDCQKCPLRSTCVLLKGEQEESE